MATITVRFEHGGVPVAAGHDVITQAPYGPFTTDVVGKIEITVPAGWGPHILPVSLEGDHNYGASHRFEAGDDVTIPV